MGGIAMTNAPFNDDPKPDAEADDTALYARLDDLLAEGVSQGIDRAGARRMEDTFLSAFRGRLRLVPAVPHPIEGTLYDINPEKEAFRDWDEREEAARHLLRAGGPATLKEMPLCRGVQMIVNRKSLFGSMKPRVSVIAACWSPLEHLAKGSVPFDSRPGDIDAVDWVLERTLVADRPNIYHYIGICSTTGWDQLLRDPPPAGPNYTVALVEPRPPGWMVYASPNWPLPLLATIEPEDGESKKRRAESTLRSSDELDAPGGLLLVEELADKAVVPYELALEVARNVAENDPSLVVEKVQGSMIVRKKRGK